MPEHTYSVAFAFVISSLIHSAPLLTMEPTATLPSPDPTTPDRRFVRTNVNLTPNQFAGTFTPSSQPVESTQRALQASLTGNIVFANESIVDTIFQPSKVADNTMVDILAEIGVVKSLKTARRSIFSNKLGETKKYKFLVRRETVVLLVKTLIIKSLACTF